VGYYLLDHPNSSARAWAKGKGLSHSFWGYPSRSAPIRGFVLHIPVALADYTGPDLTAEKVAAYFSTVTRAASAHVNIDRDSTVELLPDSYTAFHAKDGDARTGTVGQGLSGYVKLGRPLDEFDVVYGYPWSGEEALMHDLMKRYGSPDACLLLHRVSGEVEAYRGGKRVGGNGGPPGGDAGAPRLLR